MQRDTLSTPLFRQTVFREYRPPAIEPPRRNYVPMTDFVSMETIKPNLQTSAAAKPAVDLDEQTLARGRAASLAKRAQARTLADRANANRSVNSPRQQIVDLLRERAPEALASREIGDALGLPRDQISSRLGQHIRQHPGEIEILTQPKTAHRLYRWAGAKP